MRLSLPHVAFFLAPLGCAPATKVVPLQQPNAYRIECVEPGGCQRKAAETCGSRFAVVSEWKSPIAESDLPGPNEYTEHTGVLGETRAFPRQSTFAEPTSNAGPTFESLEPIGMTELEVVCSR